MTGGWLFLMVRSRKGSLYSKIGLEVSFELPLQNRNLQMSSSGQSWPWRKSIVTGEPKLLSWDSNKNSSLAARLWCEQQEGGARGGLGGQKPKLLGTTNNPNFGGKSIHSIQTHTYPPTHSYTSLIHTAANTQTNTHTHTPSTVDWNQDLETNQTW